MSADDRLRWDEKYLSREPATVEAVGLPPAFAAHADEFPTAGRALDVACGGGAVAVWLARRGLEVWGLDVSPVAVGQARDLARLAGVADHCRFDVVDLDNGLPPGPPIDVIVCHKFRARSLDPDLVARLAPGGLLAISALSEVGAVPGPFRAKPGELRTAFGGLEIVDAGESGGETWLLGRSRRPPGDASVVNPLQRTCT